MRTTLPGHFVLIVVVVAAFVLLLIVVVVVESSRTDPDDDVLDVTSFWALDVVELKKSLLSSKSLSKSLSWSQSCRPPGNVAAWPTRMHA